MGDRALSESENSCDLTRVHEQPIEVKCWETHLRRLKVTILMMLSLPLSLLATAWDIFVDVV